MESKVIFSYSILCFSLYVISLSVTALDLGDVCIPDHETEKCDENFALECIKRYEQDTTGFCDCAADSHWETRLNPTATNFGCLKNAESSCTLEPDTLKCALNSECLDNNCTCSSGFVTSPRENYQQCVGLHNTKCTPESPDSSAKRCNNYAGLLCSSIDTDNYCHCPGGPTVWSSLRQKCLAKVNTFCLSGKDDDCVENSKCDVRLCACLPGYTVVGEGNCLVQHGSPCRIDGTGTPCNTEREATICSPVTGRCQCSEGEIFQAARCRKIVGTTCAIDAECLSYFCHPIAKTCMCLFDQVEISNKTCSRMERGYNNICLAKSDCTRQEHLLCEYAAETPSYGHCKCVEGMIWNDRSSECTVAAGGSCITNRNCVQNSVCIESVCQCNPNSIRTRDNACHLKVDQTCNAELNPCNSQLGLSCEKSTSKCVCGAGQQWLAPVNKCAGLVSGDCSAPGSFCTPFSHCNGAGICQCNEGFSSTPERTCLRSFNMTCNDDLGLFCNKNDFLECSLEKRLCECKYSKQQIYDPKAGKCLSVSEGFCGILLEENNLEMECAKFSTCQKDVQGISRCVCDEEAVGAGRLCPAPLVTSTTEATTTTTSTTSTTTSTTTPTGSTTTYTDSTPASTDSATTPSDSTTTFTNSTTTSTDSTSTPINPTTSIPTEPPTTSATKPTLPPTPPPNFAADRKSGVILIVILQLFWLICF